MVNQAEYEICNKRGHSFKGLRNSTDWKLCQHCGIWQREVHTLEEREDEPPVETQDTLDRLSRHFGKDRPSLQ